jgi:hypothetical protein
MVRMVRMVMVRTGREHGQDRMGRQDAGRRTGRMGETRRGSISIINQAACLFSSSLRKRKKGQPQLKHLQKKKGALEFHLQPRNKPTTRRPVDIKAHQRPVDV